MIGLIRKLVPETPVEKEQKPLTREQRRARERLNKEAGDMIARLVNQWYEFFLDNDPDSKEVQDKQKEVSAKWRMYCQRRHLKPEILPLIDKSIDKLIDEYKKAKAE
jgi:hypothetical protein